MTKEEISEETERAKNDTIVYANENEAYIAAVEFKTLAHNAIDFRGDFRQAFYNMGRAYFAERSYKSENI